MRLNRTFPPFALLSLLIAASLFAESPATQLSLIEQLRAASEANEHEKVVELATKITAVNPGRAEAWYLLGRHAEPLGRHELVISASRRAWDLGYHFMPWTAVRIARAAAALDEKSQAFEWLQKALDAGLEDRQWVGELDAFGKYHDDARFRVIAAMPRKGETRSSGLRHDIDLFVEEAQRVHAGPSRPAFSPGFTESAADLRKRVDELSDSEFVWKLARLTARLGDGHSVMYGPREGTPLELRSSMLPIKVYLFEEGLYVVDSYDSTADPLVGRRIVAMGERSPAELLEASRELHGSDNDMTMLWLAPQFYFPRTDFLQYAGAIDDPSSVTLSIEEENGTTREVTLETGEYPIVRKLRPSSAIAGKIPLYLRNVEENYWMQPLPDHSALYVQFNQVRDAESESIEQFAERLGTELRNEKIENLIVDVRHNNGGNNGLLRPLLREIVAFDVRAGTTVFVVTGRNTFSAAQNFINRLEQIADVIFVGEPSSSSPNFTGEETALVLPWSRIAISISSRHWQDSTPGDERSWIAPHILAGPTASDYFAGRDAALEAILSAIDS